MAAKKILKWQDLSKSFAKSAPTGAFAFCGPELFLKSEQLALLKTALTGGGDTAQSRYAVDTFLAGEVPVKEIGTMVTQTGLFGGDRLILIENIEKLTRAGKKDKETWQSIVAAATVNPIILLSSLNSKELARKSKFLGSLIGGATIVDFWHLHPRDAERWVTQRLIAAGVQAQPGVATYLVEHLGCDLQMLAQEVDKISLLFIDDTHLTLEALKKQIHSGILGSAWECVTAAMTGNLRETMERLQSVRREESAFSFAWKLSYSAGNALDGPQDGYRRGGGGNRNVALGAGQKRLVSELLRSCYEWESHMKTGRWLGGYDYLALEAIMIGHALRTANLKKRDR
jgi:DNA polymerase III delta subunit